MGAYDAPKTAKQIAEDFAVPAAKVAALSRRLRALEKLGVLVRNRRGAYALPRKLGLIAGRVQAHRDGYGFCVPDDGGSDLYLSQSAMRSVLNGDRVLARVSRVGRDGRRSGEIARVIWRAHKRVVGAYTEQSGVGLVRPHDNRLPHVLVSKSGRGKAACGDHVVAKLVRQPSADNLPECVIDKVLHAASERDLATQMLIESNEVPDVWPKAVLAEADSMPTAVTERERAAREDLTGLPLVTIDGESARDFDDAVWCERRSDGSWRLLVAIADVSHYVRVGSAIDAEAMQRGTSVYLPHKVLPMLPEKLSNDLCSLRPKVPRLCHVCDMSISKDGELLDFKFRDAVMRSAARLSYKEVAEMMELGGSPPPALASSLKALYQLLRARQRLRQDTGGLIEFRSAEFGFSFAADDSVKSVFPVPHHDSHKLIEECMLLANIAAARTIAASRSAGIFRVHDVPAADKLLELRSFLRHLGLELGKPDVTPTTKDYADLLQAAAAAELQDTVSAMALRSMPLAVYSSDNRGHFGLGFDAYTHFTSPIRRYADLLVHRMIRGQDIGDAERTELLASGCSALSRRAEEVERGMTRWCCCDFMRSRIGEVFVGTVSAVCSFGLFVELQGGILDGLLHVSALPGDYYEYDYERQVLSGQHRKRRFAMAQKLRVRLTKVDMAELKVDLEFVADGAA